jgi:hypothetical protein
MSSQNTEICWVPPAGVPADRVAWIRQYELEHDRLEPDSVRALVAALRSSSTIQADG